MHTNTLPYLDQEIRSDAISAVTRISSEPHNMALTLRTCLESLVLTLLDVHKVGYSDDDDLAKLIELLEMQCIVTNALRQQMDEIRRLGNKAAHPKKRRYVRSYISSATAFIEVAKWANEHLRLKKAKRLE
jgi:hypothetical protein